MFLNSRPGERATREETFAKQMAAPLSVPPQGNPIDYDVLDCLERLETAVLRIGAVDPVGADVHVQSTSSTQPQFYPPTARYMWRRFRLMCDAVPDQPVTLAQFKRCLMLLRLPQTKPLSPRTQKEQTLQAAGKSKIKRNAPSIDAVDHALAVATFTLLDCDSDGSIAFKDFAKFFTGATTTKERKILAREAAARAKRDMDHARQLAKGTTAENVAAGLEALRGKFERMEKISGRIELFYRFKWSCNARSNELTLAEFTRGVSHLGLVGIICFIYILI